MNEANRMKTQMNHKRTYEGIIVKMGSPFFIATGGDKQSSFISVKNLDNAPKKIFGQGFDKLSFQKLNMWVR